MGAGTGSDCSSGRLRCPSGAEQLPQVGNQAHQFPLAADVVQIAQAEAPGASLLLDLSEDRFDYLSPPAHYSPMFRLKLKGTLPGCRLH